MADNIRSIPSVLDGFKPGQRKILYGSFNRNLKHEIKVIQLAGYVSEHTGYHHGEQSLVQTIIGLAQDFVGSNNINLLKPNGSFGTRNMGGKDASAARYIYTELTPITRKIFNPSDEALYTYEEDDGNTVEPTWYLPVIPMVLVNGAEGIGTGWSTLVPQFNPKDIARNIQKLMRDEEMDELTPWFKGWDGQIQKVAADKYKLYGKIEKLDANTLAITELPAKTWTSNVKEFLLQGLAGTEKQKPWIKDLQEQHGLGIRFIVTLTDEEMRKTEQVGFYERFKLTSNVNLSNMILFDPNGKIKKYDNPNEIINEFYWIRLDYYQRRKDYLAKDLSNQLEKISSQARFIKLIIDKKLNINNRKRIDLIADLLELRFPKFDKKGNPIYEEKLSNADLTQEEVVANEEEESDAEGADNVHKRQTIFSNYDYLLGLPIWSLTRERYEKLLNQKARKEDELTQLLKLSAKDLWHNDLDDFLVAFDQFLKDDEIKRTTLVFGKKNKSKKRKALDDDWSAGSRSKKKKVKDEVDERRGQLIIMPDYVAPKPKVKKEITPKIEETGTSSSSTASSVSAEVKIETGKQSTLPFSSIKKEEKVEKKEEKPKFKSFFGKSNTIFGSPAGKTADSSTTDDAGDNSFSSKFSSAASAFNEKSSPVPDDAVIDISSDEDIAVVQKPVKKAGSKLKAKRQR
jgi:DNA topoisomerase-2